MIQPTILQASQRKIAPLVNHRISVNYRNKSFNKDKNHKKIKFETDDEMFLKCNQYHNMQMLNGRKENTKCL